MKKLTGLIICIMLLLSAFSLYGCGGRKPNDGITEDEEGNVSGTITIWSGAVPFHHTWETSSIPGENYDPDGDSTKYMIQMIKAKYPKVNIVIESKGTASELNSALRQAKVSGRMPDIVIGEQFILSQIQNGYFQPLTVPAETYSAIDEIYWNQSKGSDGKQYGYPAMTGCFSLIYNEKMFIDAGVYVMEDSVKVAKVPQTLAEVRQTAAQIKNYYNDKSVSGFLLNAVPGVASAYRNGLIMEMFGGGFYDNGGSLILNSAPNISAFEWIQGMLPYTSFGNISITDEGMLNREVLNGKVAMAFEIAPLLAPFDDIDTSNLKVAPLPAAVDGTSVNMLVGSTSYLITKECSSVKVAQDILEMMVSSEMQSYMYMHSTNRLPIRRDVIESMLLSEDAEVIERNKTLQPYISSLYSADKIVMGIPSFTKDYTTIWDTWTAAVQSMLGRSSSPAAELKTVHDLIVSTNS